LTGSGHKKQPTLLAQFRETRAYPLVVRFSLLPSDLLGSLCGDFLTENLGQVMASVCGGELEGIQSVVENESADEYARCAAITALTTLVAAGIRSREEIVGYFAQLFRGKLARKWSRAWDELVACTTDLYPLELFADIEQAYMEGLVDPQFISLENVKRDLAGGKDWALAMLTKSPHRDMVMDTAKEMGWWNCFEGNEDVWVKAATRRKPVVALLEPRIQLPRRAGTSHVLAVAARSTRSAAVDDRRTASPYFTAQNPRVAALSLLKEVPPPHLSGVKFLTRNQSCLKSGFIPETMRRPGPCAVKSAPGSPVTTFAPPNLTRPKVRFWKSERSAHDGLNGSSQ
jgi:hypothetical protein